MRIFEYNNINLGEFLDVTRKSKIFSLVEMLKITQIIFLEILHGKELRNIIDKGGLNDL